jgi:hypothetical protein
MSTDFHSLALLQTAHNAPPEFTSAEQVFEYHDEFLYRESDEGVIDYVLTSSRRDWLKWAVERLCSASAVPNLSFLYGSPAVHFKDVFAQSVAGLGEWCVWRSHVIVPDDLEKPIESISMLFEWSRNNVADIASDEFMGTFASEGEILNAIEQPTLTREPTFDDRVGSDDGDGPWCLYSFLVSMQQLMRNARQRDVPLRYLVQVPR